MNAELSRKVLSTVAALAATGAVVFGVQLGVQALLSHSGGEYAYEPVEPPVVPAPRTYDLYRDIPEDLDFNIAGMSVDRRTEKMDMPVETARRILADKAAAAGWEQIDPPLVTTFAESTPGDSLWRRPDNAVVARRLSPLADGRSQLDEYVYPVEAVGIARPNSGREAFTVTAAARGNRIRLRLPHVVGDVLAGGLVCTHRIVRGSGTAFYVTCVSEEPIELVRKRFHANAREQGWTFDARQADRAEKENLAVQATFSPYFDDEAVIAVYRFTDDENYIMKGKEQ